MKNTIVILISLVSICCLVLLLSNNFKTKPHLISNKITHLKNIVNLDSVNKLGFPKRILEQYVVINSSPKYYGKSYFIVDTKENLVYFFDKNSKFVAKSPTIDGFDKQSSDSLKIRNTLKSWSQTVGELGFLWDYKTKKYVDTTNDNRTYSPKLVYDYLGKQGIRFFPKGVYKVGSKYHSENFLGKSYNTYDVETMDGLETAIAIHGLYKSQYRIQNMKKLISTIGSDYDEVNVSENYEKLIYENDNNSKFNNSFGCINVPERFLELTKNSAVESLIFVLGDTEKNYLVK